MSAAGRRSPWWLLSRRRTIRPGAVIGAVLLVVAGLWGARELPAGDVPRGWETHRVGETGTVAAPGDWEAATFDPPGGQGACERTGAEGLLVIEAGLWDACPRRSSPPRLVVGWSAAGIAPDELAAGARVEVAGQPARRVEDPRIGHPGGVAVPGYALVVPSLELHVLVRDEVPEEVAAGVQDSLDRRGGPHEDRSWVLEDRDPPGSAQGALWAVDTEARVYPLAPELDEEIDFSRRWPANTEDAVAHAWVAGDRLRVASGGPGRQGVSVLVHEGAIRAMHFTPDGSALLWLEEDADGPMLGVARWQGPERLLAGERPAVELRSAEGLPAGLDRGVLDVEEQDGDTRVIVPGASVGRDGEWTLRLDGRGSDVEVPDEVRFARRR